MNKKHTCSVIIIAKNEASRIVSCMEHLRFADEVIVVDNGSTDETAKQAKLHDAIVVQEQESNFSLLRNIGAKTAQSEWILYVDADEIVTPELAREIQHYMRGATNAYFIPRINFYLGHRWPTKDKMIRLIRKSALRSWEGTLHEHPVIDGEIKTTTNSFIHTTHRTLTEMVEKTNEWSETEASLRFAANHPRMSYWRFFRVMLTAFNESFFKQQGWKAGVAGLVESIFQAFSMFITYAKLWEKQLNTHEK